VIALHVPQTLTANLLHVSKASVQPAIMQSLETSVMAHHVLQILIVVQTLA
jgi:hypothetical protein